MKDEIISLIEEGGEFALDSICRMASSETCLSLVQLSA